MKTIFVGIFLTIYSFAFSQVNSENPLNNKGNYKTGLKPASDKGIKTTKKSVFRKNYKKSNIENPENQETNNLVDSSEKSIRNRNYKTKR
ncbi:MAG: hypothetical protein IPH28_13405 [Cytophagaceae bacterium]|nr:hypothetical protein [Cytophagaceae bacterium]MBK9932929.1 hypothetical protein [Cytophagaceae bacterium]MBL0303360.1 hypothetical protein [Cytophagaceae bacterium]MBL0326209.1 hypothetical protein [Cytophagaceae bacterium]